MLKKIITGFIFIIILPINMISSEDNDFTIIENTRLTSTFCDSRSDHFHTGIDIGGKDVELIAPLDSEIIFYNINRKNNLRYGNGNFVIIEDNEHKYRMNYSHLKDKSVDYEKTHYKKNEKIGIIGNSGYSFGSHVHFEIEDIHENRLINPLKFINVEDNIEPRILDLFFILDDNTKISLSDWRNRKINIGGKLYIKCEDKISENGYSFSPYKINVFIDGEESITLTFDYLYKYNNDLVLQNGGDFKKIYNFNEDLTYYLDDLYFLPGVIGLKVVVEDINGNSKSFTRNFIVEYP